MFKKLFIFLQISLFLSLGRANEKMPNILFAISDDQSWIHCSAYGDLSIKTPAFDRIASEGVLFKYAFASSPSCAPSRSAILTGKNMWELEEAGNLLGRLNVKFKIYTDVLKKAGYELAATGKTWGPGSLLGYKNKNGSDDLSRKYTAETTEVLTGKAYNSKKLTNRYKGINNTDYAANFEDFLNNRDRSKPFHFWYGAKEPHLGYEAKSWKKERKKLSEALVPKFLPQVDIIREEFLDYSIEIEHFDKHLEKMIKALENHELLENTIIVVCSDHGNPMPRSKANLYDSGIRVPLAIRWPKKIYGGRVLDDIVNLIDLAPTFIEFAGLDIPSEMTGVSLVPLLRSKQNGLIDKMRDHTVSGFERHIITRRFGVGYPMRSIRSHKYSYIRNYEPNRWPAGDPDYYSSNMNIFGDTDSSRSKKFLMENQSNLDILPFYIRAFGRRPAEELYDMEKDPDQLINLAYLPEYADIKKTLKKKMNIYLQKTGDPRQLGHSPWDNYKFVDDVIYQNIDWQIKGRTEK